MGHHPHPGLVRGSANGPRVRTRATMARVVLRPRGPSRFSSFGDQRPARSASNQLFCACLSPWLPFSSPYVLLTRPFLCPLYVELTFDRAALPPSPRNLTTTSTHAVYKRLIMPRRVRISPSFRTHAAQLLTFVDPLLPCYSTYSEGALISLLHHRLGYAPFVGIPPSP